MTTVQDLVDWCEEHGHTPSNVNVNIYGGSSLWFMPAVIDDSSHDWTINLDY